MLLVYNVKPRFHSSYDVYNNQYVLNYMKSKLWIIDNTKDKNKNVVF